eukprot:sb/3466767/
MRTGTLKLTSFFKYTSSARTTVTMVTMRGVTLVTSIVTILVIIWNFSHFSFNFTSGGCELHGIVNKAIVVCGRETKKQTASKDHCQEPTDSSNQPIRTRCLGHVTGYQPIRDQYLLNRSVPDHCQNHVPVWRNAATAVSRSSFKWPMRDRFRERGNKVGDGHLVIPDSKRGDVKQEWATIIGRVMSQQQDAVDAEEDARRIIKSSVMEGVGHFVYRRGTNSEKILERHTRSYRSQNGVSDEMLQEFVALIKAAVKTSGQISDDPHKPSIIGVGIKDAGTRSIKHHAGIKAHELVSDFRRKKMMGFNSTETKFVISLIDNHGSL